MKHHRLNTLFFSVSVALVSFVGAIIINIAYAQWTGPVGAPPTSNAPAPLNVGSTAQTKTGALTVGGLNVAGNLTATGKVCDSVGCIGVATTGAITKEVDPTVNSLAKATLACAANQIPQWSGTAWSCVTAPTGGITTEVDPNVNALGKATLACLTGEVAKWNGASWACAADNAGAAGASYTAGTGISISAANVISANTTTLQSRVTGTCANGINTINADGTVVCASGTSAAVYQ